MRKFVKEHYNSKIPVKLGVIGTTIGHHIFYSQSEDRVKSRLRVHELKHVEQYEKYGVVGFLVVYFYDYIKGRLKGYSHMDSYFKIKFEIEAYEAEYKFVKEMDDAKNK